MASVNTPKQRETSPQLADLERASPHELKCHGPHVEMVQGRCTICNSKVMVDKSEDNKTREEVAQNYCTLIYRMYCCQGSI